MNEKRMDSRLDKAFERLREVPPPEEGRQAAQRRVFVSQVHRVQQATATKQIVSRQPRRSFWPVGLASRRMALAGAMVALLLVMVTGTGVIYAADAAVPGDALYRVDQTVESVRLSLTTRPQATARLLVSMAQERLAEAEELSSRGDTENLAVALDGFGTAVASLAETPADTAQEDADAVAALLDEEFSSQDELPVLPVPDVDVSNPDDDDDESVEQDSNYCVTGEVHPVAARLAETYGVSESAVMGWFCDENYGMGEIMLALQTAQKIQPPDAAEDVDMEAAAYELLAEKTAQGGWGKVWQDLGLIGNGRKAAAAPTDDDDPPDEEVPDVEVVPDPEEVYCVGADPHPVGQELADRYHLDYGVVMGWFCDDHYGMGEIKIALQVSGTLTTTQGGMVKTLMAQDLLDLRAEMGWGEVWHTLGLKGKPKKLAEEAVNEIAPGASGEVHGNNSKEKEPKVKPDAATKPKPEKPDKPAKPAKPVKPANVGKPVKESKPVKTPKPPKN